MDVDEIGTQRFDTALELFNEGHPLRFDAVRFRLADDSYLDVNVESSWSIGNVDNDKARADLDRAKNVFNYLLENSGQFKRFVEGRPLRFSLIHFDGRDSVELGSFIDDEFVCN